MYLEILWRRNGSIIINILRESLFAVSTEIPPSDEVHFVGDILTQWLMRLEAEEFLKT